MVSSSKRRSKAASALLALTALPVALLAGGVHELVSSVSATDETDSRTGTRSRIRARPSNTAEESRRLRDVEDVPLEEIERTDSNMIDFVVAGFPKCGTTYIQNKVLYPSERLFIPHHEIHYLANDKYEDFRNEFANATKFVPGTDKPMLSGYKAPFELGHQKTMRNLVTLFPDVRMIITLRHPVLQFESLYNYKLRKLNELIPPPEDYMGLCLEACEKNDDYSSPLSPSESGTFETIIAQKEVSQRCLEGLTFCTGNTNYHQYLSRLGLTPMDTPEELDLLDHHGMSIHRFPGWQKPSGGDDYYHQSWIRSSSYRRGGSSRGNNARLFLIEIGQLDNRANQTMTDHLVADLETFLGLDRGDIPLFPHREGDTKPKTVYDYPEGREEHVLDICLDKYLPLRELLLENSRKASEWILRYLLDPSNREVVMVSNLSMFADMVEGWKIDPCSLDDDEGTTYN